MKPLPLLLLVLTQTLGACHATRHPYGQPEYELRQIPVYRPSGVQRPISGPFVVLGALEDLTVAPVGASYEGEGLETGKLAYTYHYWALEQKLRDELQRALRRHGVNVFRDDMDLGLPVPYAGPYYPAGLCVLRGTIDRFAYSRHRQGLDVIAADLTLWLARGDTGQPLWRARKTIRFSTTSGVQDAFALLADALAGALVQDGRFKAPVPAPTALTRAGGVR